ncbi:hypothetical protein [Roseovarius rhodophyticola]|uniref:Uncharacterized protein n=1 Tax=Roseovarius rhodophyticola TaxID=3080827 RepID=A0ABZ2TMK7_9RHOB|nr:hypothetical protein [Roseovarius sp. W115]MDV2929320.1 hypothetical protein [Roseovarius sp. W115]
MFNVYSLGFVCVAATAIAGADYYTQSTKGGYSFGQMPVSTYVGSFSERMSQASADKAAEKAEKERQTAWRRGALEYLPEAPEGWTRRSLAEGDNAAVMPYKPASANGNAGASLLDTMQARERRAEDRKRAERSWVYENGSEAIYVEIDLYERPSSNSMIGLVAATIEGISFNFGESEKGYAVVGGVGYVEQFGNDGKRAHHFRVLNATLGFGHEAQIMVHANASSESTRQILEGIDYDGLNKLLPQPMATVGNDVVLADTLSEVAVAKQMYDLRSEFLQLRATEAQYRMANMDATAMIVNTYTQGYGGDGLLDITGGKQMNLNSLIDVGYHTAIAALMEGKSADEISAEVGKLVNIAVAFADAETAKQAQSHEEQAPEMSPELARELGGYSESGNTTESLSSQIAAATAEIMKDQGGEQGARSPGAVMMEIDKAASDADEGMVYSKSVDPAELDAFMEKRGSSDAEMRMGFALAARVFEGQHGLAENSCRYEGSRYRLECDATKTNEEAKGMAALIQRLTGQSEEPALKPQVQQQSAPKPSRLKLSNGTNSGSSCVGSFCN